jgi:hypothetical protein
LELLSDTSKSSIGMGDCMRSTVNYLDSMHGHGNNRTLRHNDLWSSDSHR